MPWKSNLLIPFAEDFYKKIELNLNTKFLKKHSLFRIFSSIEEQNNWYSKIDEPNFKNYISESNKELNNNSINFPYGYGKVSSAGRLNVSKYLLESRAHFIEKKIS